MIFGDVLNEVSIVIDAEKVMLILWTFTVIYFWNIAVTLACNSEKIDIHTLSVMVQGRIKQRK